MLVLDPKLSGPLGLISEYSFLKEHGVEAIFLLQPGALVTDPAIKNIVYICRPKMVLMKYIAGTVSGLLGAGRTRRTLTRSGVENIHSQTRTKASDQKNYSVHFLPRRTTICERVLEEEGVYGEITCDELDIDLIPFEDDLLSLEMDTSFREFFLVTELRD